ncbi:MAG TPA: tetratricopeptide repeat protein [Thermoanaerobaculia bacterium]|nr:tetratricopeptide repeat protein [Thermoanaerobaculia bacterium]
MAQPATNAKIEELRFRLKADPKSRLFYPLAEELRKAGQVGEAEQVLRGGLEAHSTYLSAWVSLGRVLRDQKKDGEAVEALSRALQLDPGNVVAARLLGDSYLSLGDKVEAIKKYKLVHALMPGDGEIAAIVENLDRELNPPPAREPEPEPEDRGAAGFSPPEPLGGLKPSAPLEALQVVNPGKILEVGHEVEAIVSELDMDERPPAPPPPPPDPPAEEEESLFDRTMPPFELREEEATGDAEPMHAAHEESPFEEPVPEYTAAAMTVEAPMGMHIEEDRGAAGFSPPEPEPEDGGLKPAAPQEEKITRLENWLSKVSRKEGPRV